MRLYIVPQRNEEVMVDKIHRQTCCQSHNTVAFNYEIFTLIGDGLVLAKLFHSYKCKTVYSLCKIITTCSDFPNKIVVILCENWSNVINSHLINKMLWSCYVYKNVLKVCYTVKYIQLLSVNALIHLKIYFFECALLCSNVYSVFKEQKLIISLQELGTLRNTKNFYRVTMIQIHLANVFYNSLCLNAKRITLTHLSYEYTMPYGSENTFSLYLLTNLEWIHTFYGLNNPTYNLKNSISRLFTAWHVLVFVFTPGKNYCSFVCLHKQLFEKGNTVLCLFVGQRFAKCFANKVTLCNCREHFMNPPPPRRLVGLIVPTL